MNSRGSIVIPAWNEEAVIERTLCTLFEGLSTPDGLPDVVLAANGCTDDTVGRARRLGLPIRILDLPPVGKAAAIRAAEDVAPDLPRLYLDADVVLHGSAANTVLESLQSGSLAARPPVQYDLDGCSWPVRCFFRTRSRLPSVRGDLCGAGIYGVSAAGRARFGQIPDVTGDDLFVARHFSQDEVVVPSCRAVEVRAPRTTAALVRTLTRVYAGNRTLARSHPELAAPTTSTTMRELLDLADSPVHAMEVAAYAGLVIAGRVGSLRRRGGTWARDHTARVSVDA
jgi:glycosyltransferase involved in cell wall biosynthesis